MQIVNTTDDIKARDSVRGRESEVPRTKPLEGRHKEEQKELGRPVGPVGGMGGGGGRGEEEERRFGT